MVAPQQKPVFPDEKKDLPQKNLFPQQNTNTGPLKPNNVPVQVFENMLNIF